MHIFALHFICFGKRTIFVCCVVFGVLCCRVGAFDFRAFYAALYLLRYNPATSSLMPSEENLHRRLVRRRSSDRLAALERGSRSRSVSRERRRRSGAGNAWGMDPPPSPYAFSADYPRQGWRNALILIFATAILFFTVFALTKLPIIVFKSIHNEPIEFSSNLAAVGLSMGVHVTTSTAFLVTHIVVASALESLLALVMLRKLRMSSRYVRNSVFVLSVVHCALILPNLHGLPGPAGNVVFVSIVILATTYLCIIDSKSQLAFSWLVMGVNAGPVGEVLFWLTKLLERLEVPMAESNRMTTLTILGLIVTITVAVTYFTVAVYNVWFFTRVYGALPASLFTWTRGLTILLQPLNRGHLFILIFSSYLS